MDFLELLDEYESEAYDDVYGMQICQHYDCRDPRNGPWVSVKRMGEGPIVMCVKCFRIYVVGEDPNEVID